MSAGSCGYYYLSSSMDLRGSTKCLGFSTGVKGVGGFGSRWRTCLFKLWWMLGSISMLMLLLTWDVLVVDVIKRSYVESYFDAWGAKFGYTWNFIMSRTQEVWNENLGILLDMCCRLGYRRCWVILLLLFLYNQLLVRDRLLHCTSWTCTPSSSGRYDVQWTPMVFIARFVAPGPENR